MDTATWACSLLNQALLPLTPSTQQEYLPPAWHSLITPIPICRLLMKHCSRHHQTGSPSSSYTVRSMLPTVLVTANSSSLSNMPSLKSNTAPGITRRALQAAHTPWVPTPGLALPGNPPPRPRAGTDARLGSPRKRGHRDCLADVAGEWVAPVRCMCTRMCVCEYVCVFVCMCVYVWRYRGRYK